MTPRIENTVFISYRRTNYWTALAVYQNLIANNYDVFLDYRSIPSGDFEQVITENVKSRAHFIVILSPSALERCHEPGDWLRREIELAIETSRNIIPLMMEGFDFGSVTTANALTGKLTNLKKYSGIGIPAEYFDEAMAKLRSDRFLNRPLESVLHPVSNITKQITEEQKSAASEASPVEKEQLTAQEWFERGNSLKENNLLDEAIRCYSEAIRLSQDFAEAYAMRGILWDDKGNFRKAISDFNKAISTISKNEDKRFIHLTYTLRGLARHNNNNFNGAISDFNTAMKVNPNDADLYFFRANAYFRMDEIENALNDYGESIRLKPDNAEVYFQRARVRRLYDALLSAIEFHNPDTHLESENVDIHTVRTKALEYKIDMDGVLSDYNEAIRLDPGYIAAYCNRAKIWEQKEKISKAIADYQKYLELGGGKTNGN